MSGTSVVVFEGCGDTIPPADSVGVGVAVGGHDRTVPRGGHGESGKYQLPFIKWLTKLLNHRRLAALFKDQYGEKFFFPSALCHVSKAPDPSVKATPPNTPPKALIAFETGFCPRGIAGALIKCLMTNEMNSRSEWYVSPSTQNIQKSNFFQYWGL